MANIGGRYDDYKEQISAGKLDTHQVLFLTGYCQAVTASFTILNPSTLSIVPFLESPAQLKISSASVNDTALGTGARAVQLRGLDADYNAIVETVVLNGQTAVTTVNSFLRLYRLRVVSAGSSGVAAGNIYVGSGIVTAGVPAVINTYLLAEDNISNVATYTVPAGYRLFVSSIHVSNTSSSSADIYFSINLRALGQVFVAIAKGAFKSDHMLHFDPCFAIDEKTDLSITVKDGSSGIPCFTMVTGYLRSKSLDL